ncbi:MAG: MmgE/PrpD family protein [Actinobacteria bacterium]|nr:MmgE/PrpD family protein [Actinomycetota bacterium]
MSDQAELILGLTWADVPRAARSKIALLLRDFVAVSIAGRLAPTARIAADYATAVHPGDAATALLDGRKLAAPGAAWANGVLANGLDFDDGHRLVKGHPGANVIPAALAIAEATGASSEELLGAVAVGYEVALRAGMHLHARSRDYHASGAWGGLGAAAAAARLLGCDWTQTRHALGLAEYHAPISAITRSVSDPAMTKDACGWGAFVGVSSALLAASGFTGLSCEYLEDEASAAGPAERWHVLDVYVKQFPCCRWSHPAIAAALALRAGAELDAESISRVRVQTFTAAGMLARDFPTTTEEAQYSLLWPIAAALAHGRLDVDLVLDPTAGGHAVRRLFDLVVMEVDPQFEAEFPARRRATVTVETTDGAVYASPPTEAPGEPDDPNQMKIVEAKLRASGIDLPPSVCETVSLVGLGFEELLAVLASAEADAPARVDTVTER